MDRKEARAYRKKVRLRSRARRRPAVVDIAALMASNGDRARGGNGALKRGS